MAASQTHGLVYTLYGPGFQPVILVDIEKEYCRNHDVVEAT
jgi:hypothetical protein